jgi:transcriptional regulator with XRE-family HTH domain
LLTAIHGSWRIVIRNHQPIGTREFPGGGGAAQRASADAGKRGLAHPFSIICTGAYAMKKTYQTRMRELREDRDLTQKEVAAILGITQQTYALYEIGAREIPMRHFVALVKYYNLDSRTLLTSKTITCSIINMLHRLKASKSSLCVAQYMTMTFFAFESIKLIK